MTKNMGRASLKCVQQRRKRANKKKDMIKKESNCWITLNTKSFRQYLNLILAKVVSTQQTSTSSFVRPAHIGLKRFYYFIYFMLSVGLSTLHQRLFVLLGYVKHI